MVLNWFTSVLRKFSWKTRTFGRGRRRTTWRKWVPWPNFDRHLVARLRFNELEDRVAPAIFTVTNTDDTGAGSLRQAILDTNASAGADEIHFNVGTGSISIAPLSALPAITEAVSIDATTQPGWILAPIVELRGDSAGSSANGFTITASGSTIKGFVINRFTGTFPNSGHGILITGVGATGNQVAGNYIGTNAAGGAAAPNTVYGVYIGAGASNNIIGTNGDGSEDASERNVISGNAGHGIRIVDTGTDGNVVAGNYIGITADGTSILANGGVGVFVRSGATNTRVGTDGDGIADASERNVISGNFLAGIAIFDVGTNDTVIAGNYLGTDTTGTLSIGGNTGSGVYIRDSQFTRVGTNADGIADAAERNIISGDPWGVTLDVNTSFNIVAGNYIGTDVTGTVAVTGSGAGVTIGGAAHDNTIGGNSVADRNIIAGNAKNGVQITGSATTGNTIAGNYIGTNALGLAAIANSNGGIRIEAGASGNTIGGTTTAERNVIAGNVGAGISIDGAFTRDNVVSGNYLGMNAPTPAISVMPESSATYAAGTNFDGFVSQTNDPLGPWTGQSATFVGTGVAGASTETLNGARLIYRYRLQFTGPVLLSSLTMSGVAFWGPNNVLRVLDSNLNVLATLATSGGNTYQTFQLPVNQTGTTFYVDEFDTSSLWRYRDRISVDARAINLGNSGDGIRITGGANNNTIGGSAAGARNVISGNAGIGVLIAGATVNDNKIHGNHIGTNPAGTAAAANGTWGVIVLSGSNNQIGGDSTLGQGNIISGNSQGGVAIFGAGTSGNTVRGNLIGLNAAGTAAIGNPFGGVYTGEGSGFTITGFTTSGVATGTLIGGGTGQGNVISGNGNAGVFVRGTGASATIQGNRIGTNGAGTAKIANAAQGITVDTGASNVLIGTDGDGTNDTAERNLISGNSGDGILVNGNTVSNVTIAGNYIGLNAAGNAAIGNAGAGGGIFVVNGPTNVLIGGTAPGTGNVISGSTSGSGEGIEIELTGGAKVYGNIIGLDASGTIDLGNAQAGVFLDRAWDSEIGGPTSAHRNIISGNNAGHAAGVWMNLAQATNNKVYGNYIGTDKNGTFAIPNVGGGVRLSGGAKENYIGTNGDGTNDATEGNLISGNAIAGVVITAAGTDKNVVAGNYIGTDVTGLLDLGNALDGVLINAGAKSNRVGTNGNNTSDAIERNVISGNNQFGVYVTGAGTQFNVVAGNYIGMTPDGTATLGNASHGVVVSAGASNNRIGTDGSNDAFNANERNVIAGTPVWTEVLFIDAGTNANTFAGNYVGLNAAGTVAFGETAHGVAVINGPADTLIGTNGDNISDIDERNVISGFAYGPVMIESTNTLRTVVAGNYIGTNAAGTAGFPNQGDGVVIRFGAVDTQVGTDGNGSAGDANEGNLISGSAGAGVSVQSIQYEGTAPASPTTGTIIAGNRIGTNASGTAKIANSTGVLVLAGAVNTRIGTNGDGVSDSFERNVISGNANAGIQVQTPWYNGSTAAGTTSNTVIAGNYIGTTPSGLVALGNSQQGILIRDGAFNTRIGSDGNGINDAAEGNLVSGNIAQGIYVTDPGTIGTRMLSNSIGVNASGTAALGNTNHGTLVANGATVNQIGSLPAELIVNDWGNGRVKQLIPGTNVTDQSSKANLSPLGVAVAADGARFVVTQNGTLYRYNSDGVLTHTMASALGETRNIAIGPDGNIYLTVHNTNSVIRFSGTTYASLGTFISSNLTGPIGINFGPDGHLYVTESDFGSNGRIKKFNGSTGALIGQVGSLNIRWGSSPVFDTAGNIYVVERAANTILKIDGTTGSLIATLASGGNLNGPEFLAYGPDGRLYVSSLFNNSIQTYDATTGAFLGYAVSSAGGLNTPHGIAFTKSVVAGNVSSGNSFDGIFIGNTNTAQTIVAGNRFGTNAAGTAAIPNGYSGIAVSATANTRIGTDADGINDTAERNLVSGNSIYGIYISDPGANNTIVAGNWIGLAANGTSKIANASHGVVIQNGALNTLIGGSSTTTRNVISGNTGAGIILSNAGVNGVAYAGTPTKNTVISGNFIGTIADGSAALANTGSGVQLQGGVQNTRIGTNADGNADAFEGNVISGNTVRGIFVTGSGTSGSVIAGNIIGLNALGTTKLTNGNTGILVTGGAANNTIGGTAAAAKNIISGNTLAGVAFQGSGTTGNLVQGNWIGLNLAGTATIGNGNTGVALLDGSSANTVGGGAVGAGNVISGNAGLAGVVVGKFDTANGSNSNVIQGNFIGTNTGGTSAFPNSGAGILIQDGSSSNYVGSNGDGTTDAAEFNMISGNLGAGAVITGNGTTNNTLGGNTIGLNANGNAIIGNAGGGVVISGGATFTRLGNKTKFRNVISGNTGAGVSVTGTATLNTFLLGNFIGTDPTGLIPFGNSGSGVVVDGGATKTALGVEINPSTGNITSWYDNTPLVWNGSQNLISGNALHGVHITGATTGQTIVAGNYIGTDISGTISLGNLLDGIRVEAPNAIIGNGTGSQLAAFPGPGLFGNLISGNGSDGVEVTGAAVTNAKVRGNLIGLQPNGITANPNAGSGVNVNSGATNTQIGQADQANTSRANIISGNSGDGVLISGNGTTNTQLYGNKIGTTVAGTSVLGNQGFGVRIENGATQTFIGTNGNANNDALEANVISGNFAGGILITGSGTNNQSIVQNCIGTDANGTLALGNNGPGIDIRNGSSNNTIGGTSLAAGNMVVNNGIGIRIDGAATTANSLRFNRVHNNLVNFTFINGANAGIVAPSIIGASSTIETNIFGLFQGTPNTTYFVDVYDPLTLVNPSTRTYLATTTITTGPTGFANFTATIPGVRPFDSLLNVMVTSQTTGDSSPASIPVPVGLVVVEGTPSGMVAEGTPITLTTRASDPGPGEKIGYEWRVTRNNVQYDSGTESTYTFIPDDNGTYIVTLLTTTTTGLRDSIGPFTITIGNAAPRLEFVNPPANVAVGVPVSILAAIADAGTADAVTYEWLVNGTTIAPDPLNPRLLTLVPSQAGPVSIQLRVTDDDGESTTLSYAMLASGGVPSAVIDVPGFGTEGTVIHARAALADILEQDNLTFAWTVTKNGVPFAASAVTSIPNFEFTPDDDGEYVISLIVGIPDGPSIAAQNRSVFVQNLAPEGRIGFDADQNGIADESVPITMAGTPIPFLGLARDVGVNDIHTFEWSVRNAETDLIVRRGTGERFDFTALAAGTYIVTLVTSDDDGGHSTATMPIDVAGGIRNVSLEFPTSATEGSETTIHALIDDAQSVAFRYEWEVRNAGQLVFSSISPTYSTIPFPLTFTPSDDGIFDVRLSVSGLDGSSGTATESLTVENVVPNVTIAISEGPYFEGSDIQFTAIPNDPAGVNDTLSYQWFVNDIEQIGAESAVFSMNPTDNGSFEIRVVVRDEDQPPASSGGSGTVTIQVENVPTLLNLGSATDANGNPLPGVPAGYTFNLSSGAVDPGSADVLTHSWSVVVLPAGGGPAQPLPASFISDPTSRFFSFNLNPEQPGTYLVTLTVEDDDGASTTSTTQIVAGSNDVDEITVVPADLVGGASQIFVFGFGSNDVISASTVTFPVIFDGGDGDDTLTGGTGNDVLFGGSGTDLLQGGEGDDRMVSQHGNDTLEGGVGNDVYDFNPGSDGTLNERDGSGIDTINFGSANYAITFDLRLNDGILRPVDLQGNQIAVTGAFEVVVGSNYGDRITASSGTTLFGGAGSDELRIETGTSNVTLFGGEGEDHLISAGGLQVTLSGGDGNDLIEAIAGTTLITLFGGAGDDDLRVLQAANITLFGGEGVDEFTLTQASNVTVFGGEGADTINVVSGESIVIVGSDGQVGELVPGMESPVTLFGGTGNDDDQIAILGGTSITVFGGEGSDAITLTNDVSGILVSSGVGEDVILVEGMTTLVTLFGGEGNDQFILLDGVTNVIVSGDDGRDLIRLAEVASLITLFGGEGDDRIELLNGVSQVLVSGGAGIDEVVANGTVSLITLFGGEGDDRVTLEGGVQSVLVSGDAGSESITVGGTANQITLFGGVGDDAIDVIGGANITVFGGEGHDAMTVTGIATGVTVFGGEGNDHVLVSSTGLNITVSGGEGNDTIETASMSVGNVTLFGGEGDDHLIVTAGTNVTVFGEAGSDIFEVLNGTNVTVFGGEGNDEFAVRSGVNVTVFGGEGDDRIQVNGGVNVTVLGAEGQDEMTVNAPTGVGITLFGGEGDDVLSVLAGTAVTIFGSEGNDSLSVSGGTNITVFGGEGDDFITTNAPTGASITLFGGEGDDSIHVLDGMQVTVFGELGLDVVSVDGGTNVTVFGGEGSDTISIHGGENVTVLGGDAADRIEVQEGTKITVFGGEGDDTLTVIGGEAVTVLAGEGNDSLTAGTKSGVTMFGGEGDDTIVAAVGDTSTLFGESGNDRIEVLSGSHITIFGGDGIDSVTIGKAVSTDVTVFGGEGDDTIRVEGGTQVTIVGEGGNDKLTSDAPAGLLITLFGGAGDDTIHVLAGSQLTVFGESGVDLIDVASTGTTITVFGGSGDDQISATAGVNVQLLGDRGNDRLTSQGVSNITLFGGAGNDVLQAGGGLDVELFGDDGDDYYKLNATANPTRIRVKEIQTIGQSHDPAEKLFLGDDGGSSHVDRGSTGAETLDLSEFDSITIDLTILGSDKEQLLGWQTVTALNGWSAVLILHGYFENVVGTAGNDLIVGNDFDNVLLGGTGNDSLVGLAGNDSLAGGEGNDVLDGGVGNDTVFISGANFGNDSILEVADRDADTLDVSGLHAAISINLGTTGTQEVPGGSVALSDATGIENIVGTAGNDVLVGNARPNRLEGSGGNDELSGQSGDDTYVFPAEQLGTDTITEQSGIDTLDFSRHLGGIVLDLSSPLMQWNSSTETGVILANPDQLEDVIGTSFGDRLIGNAGDNALIGGGGLDNLDGGLGNNLLRGGSGQVIFLDFTSHTSAWEWQYDAGMQDAIVQRMSDLFKPFGYEIVLSKPTFGTFLTVAFNDGPQGGAADEIDFRNLGFGGTATVNVTDLLPLVSRELEANGLPVPSTVEAWSHYVMALSATIASHELGHYLGLRHGDAYGPIGTGVNSAKQAVRYLPILPESLIGAVETKYHVMASPEAHGISLLDSAGLPFFGVREAIKLAFADTGTTLREPSTGYNDHGTFATAVPLGRLTGLSVPNTLVRPDDPLYGQPIAVAATTVLGSIIRNSGEPQSTSENDVFSFAASQGEIYHFEINSYNLARIRNPIDSVLRIYDANGKLLFETDDEFETADAVIVDWLVPHEGEFYLEVDTFTPDGIRDFDTGQYELFIYRAEAGGDLGLGDTIVSSGGMDQIQTSTGRDRIKVRSGATAVIDVKGEADPIVDTTEGGSFEAFVDETPVSLPNISVNHLPQLGPIEFPATLSEGHAFTITLSAFDADIDDRLTYRLVARDGFSFPASLSVGEVDGIVHWTPIDEGTFGFRIVVTDIVGGESAKDVTVVVDNLNPAATVSGPVAIDEGATATFTSLISDPGPIDILVRRWTIDGIDAGTGPALSFIPAENRVYLIGLSVEDGDGGKSFVQQLLTVNNLAPVARIVSFSGIPDERSTLLLTGIASDAGGPGDLVSQAWTIRKDGAIVAESKGSSYSWTPEDDGLYEVILTASDVDGTSHSDTKTIRVFNRAPVVDALPNLTVVEGEPVQFHATFTDNPSDAPFSILWRVTSPSLPVPDGSSESFGFTTSDSGTYSVLLKVTDKDGASTDVLTTVTVVERLPVATFQQNGPVFETDPVIVGFINPDDSPIDLAAGLKYSFALNPTALATTYAAAGSATTASIVLPDNGSFMVYGRVIDQNGTSTDYSTIVFVNNSAPTATLVQSGPVVENNPVTVSLVNAKDGSADLAAGLKYSFALTPGDLAADYLQANSSSTSPITFNDSGVYSVYARIFDQDGAWTDYETVVSIHNAAPTALFGTPASVDENSPAVVSFTMAFDPSPADLAAGLKYSLSLTPDDLATSYALAGDIDSRSFTFADNGGYTVFGRIFDKDGGSTDYTTIVTVRNAGPVAGIAGPTTVMVGQTNLYTLTAVDPSPVDQSAGFTFEIDWNDDGTADQTIFGPSGTTVSHVFSTIGLTSVRVRAIDKDQMAGTESVLPVNVQVNSPTVAVVNGNLVVTGTLLGNEVRINRDGTKLAVRIDSVNYGTFAVPGSVIVYAGGGNDDVRLDPDLNRRSELYGQEGNDTLRGGAGADRLDGGAGNDSLVAEYGNDSLFGGLGDDILKSGYGDDLLDGGDGYDSLLGSYGRDLFRGGIGNDTVICGDGNDTAFGESGDDSLIGGLGNDSLDGGEGNDTISGGDGRDTVFAGFGNDSVTGGIGNDYLDAGDGADIVSGGADDDTIFGGVGDDRLEGNSENDRIDGGTGFADSILGGDGNDVLSDADGAALMSGGIGTDSLTISFAPMWSLGGAFIVPPGAISGGDGNDTIRVTANNANLIFEVEGNGGNDIVELYGNWKLARILGGAGTDRLRKRGSGLIELLGVEIQE